MRYFSPHCWAYYTNESVFILPDQTLHGQDQARGFFGNFLATMQPWTYGSAYSTSKAALIRFSENLATETKEHGVAVFAICPGLVRTAMTEGLIASPEGQQWLPEFRKGLDEGYDVPPGRAAHLVRLLATGQADQLSGCFLTIDDSIDEIIKQSDRVAGDQLYVLRLRGLV